jgi:Transposase
MNIVPIVSFRRMTADLYKGRLNLSEGINNKIKRLKRMAYGYKDVTYFLLKKHQHCGLLNPRLQLEDE